MNYPSEIVEKISSFFGETLLPSYKAAAKDACAAYAQSPKFFTNYIVGAAFWNSSYGRIKSMAATEAELRDKISCGGSKLRFRLDDCSFYCYRVKPSTGIPRAANSLKQALRRDQHVLMPELLNSLPKGRLLVGLHVDPDEGLVFAELSEIRLKLDARGFCRDQLRVLYSQKRELPDFPEPSAGTRPERRGVVKLDMPTVVKSFKRE